MKNEYLEKICDRIQNGEEVGRNQRELAWAYKQPAYQKFGRICLDHPIHTDKDAAAIAQELFISENTVKTHMRRLYAKVGVHKKQQLLSMLNNYVE